MFLFHRGDIVDQAEHWDPEYVVCEQKRSTTKTAPLESIDDLRRKFDEASRYADLDQLGIAPQCGFSSTEEGNLITEDDQRRKLELVVKTAETIWGEV